MRKLFLSMLFFMSLHAQQDFPILTLPRELQKNVVINMPLHALNLPQIWTMLYCIDKKYATTLQERAQFTDSLWHYGTIMGNKIHQTSADYAKSIGTAFIILEKLSKEFKDIFRSIMARTWYMEERFLKEDAITYVLDAEKLYNCLDNNQAIILDQCVDDTEYKEKINTFWALEAGCKVLFHREKEVKRMILPAEYDIHLPDEHNLDRLPKKILRACDDVLIWSKNIDLLTCEDVLFATQASWRLEFKPVNYIFFDSLTRVLYKYRHKISSALLMYPDDVLVPMIKTIRKNAKLKPLKKHKKNCVIQ